MGLFYRWGRTFPSWPGSYSCCHGETGDSPHICYHGNGGEVAHTGLVYSAATSSSVCEPATKYYEWLPATGQETHLYVNADATHSSQYINIVTHSKMLSTTFISVPVSRQVNKDISIRHLLGGKIVQSASGGHINTYTWILLKTLINPRLHCSIRAVMHLVFLLWVSLFWFWSYFFAMILYCESTNSLDIDQSSFE